MKIKPRIRSFLALGCWVVAATGVFGRAALPRAGFVAAPDTVIPKVFIKGQSERLEELLNEQFPKQIIYVFNDNVNAAFSACARMVLDIEKYGDQTGFDIRGIKAFVTFYFDRKGGIRHIAYSLKGNSRYFKPEELERFFRQFMNVYRMPVNAKYNFQHEFQLIIPLPWIVEKH
ncbi:MAG: hypothetical protein ACK4Q5_12005 [Saprospiraceae bacterium]